MASTSASTRPPAFVIRAATRDDHRQILALARRLDSINLPTDSAQLRELLERSTRSFGGRIGDRSRAVYAFCAQRIGSGRIAGASMIIAKHGTPEAPHFYLEVESEERYSKRLGRMFRHQYLRLRHSMDGPTELGGLIVAPATRRHPERVGRQLSWVRFLYMAKHRDRFEAQVVAEMLPPPTARHRNAFWDHFGRPLTGLSFRDADRLSIHDKEFIHALFPDSPLYTFLLPDAVRAALGTVGAETRGAVRLLEQAGMRYLNQIDPFDAGPYYGGAVDELAPVKQYRIARAEEGDAGSQANSRWLVALEDRRRGFRAVAAQGIARGDRIVVAPAVLAALGAKPGDRLDTVPMP
ncbi:MAG TPA: arginine N-succinyltransferase [Candidatus Binataceae bacterium]|nr:arginine N-succinyltransferase [Candidatus Binataceae bacterium]